MNTIGTRDVAEMQTRLNYYLDLGYSTEQAIGYANADYDKAHPGAATTPPATTTKTGVNQTEILVGVGVVAILAVILLSRKRR